MRHTLIFLSLIFTLAAKEPDEYFDNPNSPALKTVLTDMNAEPTSIVGGFVNVITGDFVDFDTDLTVPGPLPILSQRAHASSDEGNGILCRTWRSNHHSTAAMTFSKSTKHQTATASLLGALGERMHYEGESLQNAAHITLKPKKEMYESGMTNSSKGAISGQTNPKNHRLMYDNKGRQTFYLTTGSDEVHRFRRHGKEHKYFLREITKPNGMRYHYTYSADRPISVELKNRAGQEVSKMYIYYDTHPEKEKRVHWVAFQAPDGRAANYKFRAFSSKREYYILTDVFRSDGPQVHYVIDEARYKKGENGDWSGYMERIKRKELPDGRFVEVDYNKKGKSFVAGHEVKIDSDTSDRLHRVKEIRQPLGPDDTPVSSYKFVYNLPKGPGQVKTTIVYDVNNRKSEYCFNQENRLTHIIHFTAHGAPYTIERLFWGEPNTSRQINLTWRVFGLFGSPAQEYAKAYEYDGSGNIIRETLFGSLTGKTPAPVHVNHTGAPIHADEGKTTLYSYTDGNKVKTMQEGELSVEYSYVPGTSLLASVIYKDPAGIYKREFYSYDENALAIEEIKDDGSTADRDSLEGATERFIRRITRTHTYPHGLPVREENFCIDLATNEELKIGTLVQHYDLRGRLVRKETFGADDAPAYFEEWAYDDYGNITCYRDPLGHAIFKTYDANGNCTSEEGPIAGVRKEMVYDRMNRLIAIHEKHEDGITLSQQFIYDLKGNKVASYDAMGNGTFYRYDEFDRMIEEENQHIETLDGTLQTSKIRYEYNALSQLVKTTDPYGNSTCIKYTILGKPYEILYPDGSLEKLYYNLQGELVEQISPTGAKTVYARDARGRILRTELYTPEGALYAVQEKRYNKNHLIEEIDALGNSTRYTYDSYGRLKTILKADSLIEHSFDSLGRVTCTLHANKEKSEGTLTHHTLDALGRILEERVEDISGELFTCTQFAYDALGRKIETIIQDAHSYTRYDTHGALIEMIDPEGNRTTTTTDYFYFNHLGQRVLKTCTIDPNGSQTITYYDTRGQKAKVEILDPYGALLHSEQYTYDFNGNLIQKIASPSPERVYRFHYDCMNRPIELYQAYGTPDQKCFSTTYNSLGKKENCRKPDGVTLHFSHDCFGRMTGCKASDQSVDDLYSYDQNNNPYEVENLLTGKKSLRSFDAFGRLLHEENQNGLTTGFTYCYDGAMKSFTLPDASQVLYSYKAGYVTEAMRKDAQGAPLYVHKMLSFDSQGNVVLEELPSHLGQMERTYSLNGNLLKSCSPYFEEASADYDGIGNLLSRTIKDPQGSFLESFSYDSLNQLQEEKGFFNHTYSHDSHQNRLGIDGTPYTLNTLNQVLSTGVETLNYDLNGNLISIGSSQMRYDALDRLIAVEKGGETATYSYDELNRCIKRNEERYFYISQAEVGAATNDGTVSQFQMVGPGRESAPCQALAVEINGDVFTALHDQSGHVRILVPHSSGSPTTYRYSAFGEKYCSGETTSPWTFAGKREDPLTHWILFGRRFYIPELGRFLTQDPAGLAASPNLYAYLGNSPLIRYDTFGLFESSQGFFSSFLNMAWTVTHAASHLIAAPAMIANTTRKVAGLALYHIGRNVVPLPYLQDIPQAAGYFLAHTSLKGYTPSFKELDYDSVEGDGYEVSNRRNLVIAGIGNTRADAERLQRDKQEAHGGMRTDVLYGPTHGLARDLVECVVEKLGIQTVLVKNVKERFQRETEAVGDNGFVKTDCHSRGGITLNAVIPHLSDSQAARIWANTFGSGSIIDSDRLMYVHNHISDVEWITFVGDPGCFLSACFKKPSHVTFHKSHKFPGDHDMLGDTYKGAFNIANKRFIRHYHTKTE